jgi:hypothetical protein
VRDVVLTLHQLISSFILPLPSTDNKQSAAIRVVRHRQRAAARRARQGCVFVVVDGCILPPKAFLSPIEKNPPPHPPQTTNTNHTNQQINQPSSSWAAPALWTAAPK